MWHFTLSFPPKSMSSTKRPKASTIGTPIYHRKRRNWQDDKDLLTELVAVIKRLDGPYDYFSPNVKGFATKVELIEKHGFEENPDAYFLAMWVREKLSELLITQGSYNLQVHPINIPNDINALIKLEEKKRQSPEKMVNRTFLWLTLSRTLNLGHLHWKGCKCYTREILLLIYLLWLQEKGNHYCLLRLALWI